MPRCPSCHRRVAGGASCPQDGASPPIAAPGEVAAAGAPPRVAGFRVDAPLGEGGSSIVWAGERERDGAPAAIKIGVSADATLDARFQLEASALHRIGAPHAPRLYGRGRLADGRPWIAMERLSGRTLAAELAALPAPPDPGWALERADALLAALEAAHARGVIHRDLKPENIFLVTRAGAPAGAAAGRDERAVLLDFGLTKEVGAEGDTTGAELTRAGTIVGTPEYMAPEQIRGDPAIDARADIYAFGVILFELLTLRPPFVGEASAVEHGHLALRPPRPGELAPVPPAIEAIALACLAKDPGRRPPNAAQLRRALAEAGAREDAAGSSEGPASTPAGAAASAVAPRLIADGRQPVVVLVAETSAPMPLVVAAVTRRKGLVVRQRMRRYVTVFSGRDADQPAQAALAAARELVDRHGARAALHLASVTIRRKDQGAVAVYGAAVDRPETWMPAGPWSGVALSADLERVLSDAEPPPSSTRAAPSVEAGAPLVGRSGALAAIEASAAAAFDGACPGLLTVIGEAGLGKSRLAAEAAGVAWRGPGAQVLSVRAAQPLPGEATREAAEVLRFALDAPGLPPGDVRAFCEERLGEAIGAAAWPAVAATLGWGAPEGGAPPASRHHDLTRAIAEGLRRRARRAPIAVILDDAHWADDAVLDALEYATLDGAGVALWAVVVAHPRFDSLRRTWGTRTQRFDKLSLAPLDEASGTELAAALLVPAEYVPADALKRLAGWSGGNPGCLTAIVRSLKRAGIVRARTNAGSHYVATTELEGLPMSAAWQWLATRQLEALPPELAAYARLCAVLGVSFTKAELERVADAVDRAGGAGTPVDAGYGLSALVERRILRRGAEERYTFQSGVLQDAVYEMLDPAHRQDVHAHALRFWRARVDAGPAGPEALEALGRHAGACGAREEAAVAHLRLGDLERARHRYVEADHAYTAALAWAAEGDARGRALARMGRGKIQYRLHRAREAMDDLSAARALGEQLGDEALAAEALLEEATALDWMGDYEASARRVEEARPWVERSGSRRLATRLLVARGRTCVRAGQVADAIALLEEGAAEAEAAGEHEGHVVALVLLPVELAHAGRFEDAKRRAQEAIDLCAAAQDLPHLCIATMNRVVIWTLTRAPSQATEDLRRVISLAREIGNPWLERVATYNVAEVLYWSDQREEALALARRARVLEERFIERPVPECSLLLARILAAAGQDAEASRLVAWIARSCPPDPATPVMAAFFHLLQWLAADAEGGAPEPRDALGAAAAALEAEGLFADELLEILYWRARVDLRRARGEDASATLDKACALLEEHPAWRARFEDLTRAARALRAGPRTT